MASKAKEFGKNLGAKVDKEAMKRKAEEAKGKLGKVLFDADDGTFLGRTAESWGKILGFYAVYYFILFLIFMFSIKMIDLSCKWSNDGTRPKINSRLDEPGLIVIPHNYADTDDVKNNLMYKKVSAESEHDVHNDEFENIIDQYYFKLIRPNMDTCHPDGPVSHYTKFLWNHTVNTNTGENGFRDSLRKGKPIILLKLNRIINWQPVTVTKAKGALKTAIAKSNVEGAHFMKNMVYFTCKDGDETLDNKGRTVPGNVKQIIFHNPSASGVLGKAHNFGVIPANWYGEHEVFDKELGEEVLIDNMYTSPGPWAENNYRQCENGKSGKICSCQPFVALTVQAFDQNKPVNVKCQVHLANVEAQMDNPTTKVNYGWAKFGLTGSGFAEKKSRNNRRRKTYG